jgi:hypothetical protein
MRDTRRLSAARRGPEQRACVNVPDVQHLRPDLKNNLRLIASRDPRFIPISEDLQVPTNTLPFVAVLFDWPAVVLSLALTLLKDW